MHLEISMSVDYFKVGEDLAKGLHFVTFDSLKNYSQNNEKHLDLGQIMIDKYYHGQLFYMRWGKLI